MKVSEVKPGIWVRFKTALASHGGWQVGEVALVKDHKLYPTAVNLVSANDPKKTTEIGAGISAYLEDKPVPNPFESGIGIRARELPTGRPEPFVANVTERDLLPDV